VHRVIAAQAAVFGNTAGALDQHFVGGHDRAFKPLNIKLLFHPLQRIVVYAARAVRGGQCGAHLYVAQLVANLVVGLRYQLAHGSRVAFLQKQTQPSAAVQVQHALSPVSRARPAPLRHQHIGYAGAFACQHDRLKVLRFIPPRAPGNPGNRRHIGRAVSGFRQSPHAQRRIQRDNLGNGLAV
jgi:hypothetical protein